MPKDDKKEFFKSLGVDNSSTENDIKRAYKRIALQCHPDKNPGDSSSRRQFDEVSKAFESLVLEYSNDSIRDHDKVFFDFLRDILFASDDISDFFTYFCGSKQHSCNSSESDPDFRYQDDEDEEDIDGEQDLDSVLEIVKNRKKKGKSVPEEFREEKLQELKAKLLQHKEDMKRDSSKKQAAKKGKTQPVPVAKPKPKSKKQLLAEQRRRAKEMEQIAMELEEKRKEDEEKDKQRKQLEVEKQKRFEEERIRAQNEERKRREREQKEREKLQKQEQEKEERQRRQHEEEKKRKEEEEKRKKAEKEKVEKEKAAKKAALQAAKEKEEQAKAANKSQSLKRQQQQQRTDQQQYPREIPPRFQKMKKQQQMQQPLPPSQPPLSTPAQQQNKFQSKPQPPIGKKKDPNRFAAKEFADLVNEVDDGGWTKASQCKGSGWVPPTEDWEEDIAEKWGPVDRQWGDKEGNWEQVVVDGNDGECWPAVGNKGSIGDKPKTSLDNALTKATSSGTSSSISASKSDSRVGTIGSKASSSSTNVDWNSNRNSGSFPITSENWDATCDESIDRALDAADSKGSVGPGGVSWGGMGTGGLGGLIGTPLGWDPSKDNATKLQDWANKQGWGSENPPADSLSWSKTPGKGPKTKPVTTTTSNAAPTWGGTPAETSSGWVESSGTANNASGKTSSSEWDSKATTVNSSQSTTTSSVTKTSGNTLSSKPDSKTNPSGWGDAGWPVSASVAGTACWDSTATTAKKSVDSKDAKLSHDKVSGWLENSLPSSSGNTGNTEWNAEGNREHDEGSEGSWDGWTTASSKRNRAPKPNPANDSNAWMSRSLKQLLDMGFKQEDAEKALRANHMNIESAIGDLLSMTANAIEEASRASAARTGEPDPAEASRIQQQIPPSKQNRKQRRKTQQQQQLQQQQTNPKQDSKGATDCASNQSNSSDSSSKNAKTDGTNKDTCVQSSEAQPSSRPPVSQQGPDAKASVAKTITEQSPHPSPGKTASTANHTAANQKRNATGAGLIQTPVPGASSPLRPPITHPLLHQQFVHQVQLHQLRMAQGGLLQPPISPQQFALLQQMAQLQLVQQRLAQQQLNQKHAPLNIQTQQQLYQQQQQIALMMAQLQQQLIQQQQQTQHLPGRFPNPTFQQSPLLQQQTPSAQSSTPQGSKSPSKNAAADKATTETSQSKPEDTSRAQPPERPPVTTAPSDDRSKQQSPAPQSRLTQWKQPLLPDPEQPPQGMDGKPPINWTTGKPESGNLFTSPTISTSVDFAGNPSLSPRANRISDPVSSRWGVDASLKLSADPPEFKPGVPWRPRAEGGEGKDESSSSSATSSQSPSPQGQPPSSSPAPPKKPAPTSDSVSKGLGFSSSFPTPAQYSFGIASSPWGVPEGSNSLLAKSTANTGGIRPPPGLNSSSGVPDSPGFEEEQPTWLKNLIDVGPHSFGQDLPQGDLNFSRLGFPSSSWSIQDGSSFSSLTPNPQPWAAPGGPTPSAAAASTAAAMTSSGGPLAGTVNASSAEQSKPSDVGISSWSANQPIPSAEEKRGRPAGAPELQPPLSAGPMSRSSALGGRGANPMSTWLVLRNLSSRADPNALRAICQQHGPLLTFQLNLRHGNSLIRYGNKDQAGSARNVLNGMMVKGMQLVADFATDSDIGSFFEQTPDWSSTAYPANNTAFGSQWSSQNTLGGMQQADDPSRRQMHHGQAPSMGQVGHAPGMESKPPQGPPPVAGIVPPGMQWGTAQLWGQPGAVAGFPPQVPSMWSFATGNPREVEPQSATSENGLVSPSMTTFLPPGLLNGGESV